MKDQVKDQEGHMKHQVKDQEDHMKHQVKDQVKDHVRAKMRRRRRQSRLLQQERRFSYLWCRMQRPGKQE